MLLQLLTWTEFSRDAYLWNASQQSGPSCWYLMIKVFKMEKCEMFWQQPHLEYIRQHFSACFYVKLLKKIWVIHFRNKDVPCDVHHRHEAQSSPVPCLHICASAVSNKDDKNSKPLNVFTIKTFTVAMQDFLPNSIKDSMQKWTKKNKSVCCWT